MTEHTDPTVMQAWLIAVPSLITALSTWYLRRGDKKSHAATQAKTEVAVDGAKQQLDSYNGKIGDKILELENEIKALKLAVTNGRDTNVLIAAKYTEQINTVQKELIRARRVIEKAVPGSSQTQSTGEPEPETPVAAGPSPAPTNGKPFGDVKVVDATKAPVGKVKWEKGD